MAVNETIILYMASGKQYAQLVNWWKYQSLQYAQPSQFPRPDGWLDRVRKTVTKGFIATCNWVTVDGTPLIDTCDMDGNPIATGVKLPVIQQSPNTPITPSSNGHSPESSGSHSPESSPEDTILTKLNINKLKETKTDAAGASGGCDSSLSTEGWQEVMRAYESNIGSFTAISSELVRASTEEHGAIVVVDAIAEAVKQNIRKWSYVDGILKRWKANGRNGETPKPVKPPRVAQKITIWNQYTNQMEDKFI